MDGWNDAVEVEAEANTTPLRMFFNAYCTYIFRYVCIICVRVSKRERYRITNIDSMRIRAEVQKIRRVARLWRAKGREKKLK